MFQEDDRRLARQNRGLPALAIILLFFMAMTVLFFVFVFVPWRRPWWYE